MPNYDDIEHGYPPMTPPEGDTDGREIYEPEPIPVPPPSSKWHWIGAPDRPEVQEESDGISDLFRVTPEDVGASEEDLSDLTDVDVERDVLDADEDGSLDSLTVVTEADIMGDDEYAQRPSAPSSQQFRTQQFRRRRRIVPRYLPPTSMGRSG